MLVVGPGLGRDEVTFACVHGVISKARELSIPLVIDADGLFLVGLNPEIIRGYKDVILTPNVAEVWLNGMACC